MTRKTSLPSPFTGRRRIASMSAWDDEYIDSEEEAFFEFDEKGGGEFRFGYVQGQMDARMSKRGEVPAIEWKWDGGDEMDAAQGRVWAVIKGAELRGMLFFHQGEVTEFVAKKKGSKKTKRRATAVRIEGA